LCRQHPLRTVATTSTGIGREREADFIDEEASSLVNFFEALLCEEYERVSRTRKRQGTVWHVAIKDAPAVLTNKFIYLAMVISRKETVMGEREEREREDACDQDVAMSTNMG
jgi:hypothetical protein